MRSFDLPGLAAHLDSLAAGIAKEERVALDCAARLIKAEARQAIGQHQSAIGLPALADADLRDGIEHVVLTGSAHVGSNLPEAEARELGSPAVPPQPFLSGSAFRKATEVCDLIGDRFLNFLTGTKS